MIRMFFPFLLVAEVITLVSSITLIGFLSTIGLYVLTFMVGGMILQWQGLKTLESFMSRLEHGKAPMRESWDGFCLIAAAFLLIIPGFVSDILALLLFVPFVRAMLYRFFEKDGDYRYDDKALASSRETIIEAEYEDITYK